jgi:hypothetical protein
VLWLFIYVLPPHISTEFDLNFELHGDIEQEQEQEQCIGNFISGMQMGCASRKGIMLLVLLDCEWHHRSHLPHWQRTLTKKSEIIPTFSLSLSCVFILTIAGRQAAGLQGRGTGSKKPAYI